ncbi:MAG: homoserine O-succinyltransferase [Clostridiales bacterium]|jgi:homoserine O-succinyltransferase|nr:homoserine O-succinyltransferase [Clostridiales bacterium]
MPIKIPDRLPAAKLLKQEQIFLMPETRAAGQDIRPLRIALLNLMPNKQATEEQFLRLIGNTPLQVEVTLLYTESRVPKHTSWEYLTEFYTSFEEIKDKRYDGLIVTGAPVERLPFEEVTYWAELTKIFDWAKNRVNSSIFICWGAQAALYHYYGVPKYPLPRKMFGVFAQRKLAPNEILLRGFDDVFFIPQSRHTEIRVEDIEKRADLAILAASDDSGAGILASRDRSLIFVTGHMEYDPDTLKTEYFRDLENGLTIDLPRNYFVSDDDPSGDVTVKWRAHSHLLFANWLNYCVYQTTPYDVNKIGEIRAQ